MSFAQERNVLERNGNGYRYEYKVFQDDTIFNAGGHNWSCPGGEQRLCILFRAKFLLEKNPLICGAGPLETLGLVNRGLVMPLNDFQYERINHIFSTTLRLPEEDHPDLISRLIDTAGAVATDPRNSGLSRLPILFYARVIAVQGADESLDETLVRAIRGSPQEDASFLFNAVRYRPQADAVTTSSVRLPAAKVFGEFLEKVRVGEDETRPCCSICLHSPVGGEEITFLPCLHVYHSGCIIQWLNKSNTCPVCRQPIPRR